MQLEFLPSKHKMFFGAGRRAELASTLFGFAAFTQITNRIFYWI